MPGIKHTPSSPALYRPRIKPGQETYPSAPGTVTKLLQDKPVQQPKTANRPDEYTIPLRTVINGMKQQRKARAVSSPDPIDQRRGSGWKAEALRRFEANA